MVNDAAALALSQRRPHNIMMQDANEKETSMAVDLLNIKGLSELDQAAPVVMLNLMRFRERSLDGDGSGWDAYLRYSADRADDQGAWRHAIVDRQMLGAEQGNQWDYVALVYYPSLDAFTDMMTSPDYETKCDPHRTNGCAEHVIICTHEAYSKFKVGQAVS
jgi:hypothetical protein